MRRDEDLRRAVGGDRAALRRVVDGWMPQIRRWALLAVGEPVAAEDVVQESLVRLIRTIDRVDPERPFGPWLRTIVGNAGRDEADRRRRAAGREVSGVDAEVVGAAPGERLDLARAASRVRAAFARLTPRQREILDLVDLQGETPTEAAGRLGLTAGAVRGQLFQARRAVREGLSAPERDEIALLLEGS